jgi:hypothetical protein
MKVVYTPAHLLHNPEVEIESSTAHSPFEHTGRAEKIRETLAADKAFDFVSPTAWGTEPITKIHNRIQSTLKIKGTDCSVCSFNCLIQ